MGVYVPRMKMPECCLLCPFEHMMTCSREERYTDIHERQRPEWCPLIDTAGGPTIIFEDSVLSPNGMTINGKKVDSIAEALERDE